MHPGKQNPLLSPWKMAGKSTRQSCSWAIIPSSAKELMWLTAALSQALYLHRAVLLYWIKVSQDTQKKKKSEPEPQQLYNSRWVLELHKCHLFRKENGTEEQGPASRCEKINIWELTDLSWGSGFICLDVFSPLTDPVCMYLISSVWAAASLGLDVLNLHRRGYDMFAACFYKLAELPG